MWRTYNTIHHTYNRIKHVCQNYSKQSWHITNKKTADLASASIQHKENDHSLIYLFFWKSEKNKQIHYLNLRSMIKAINLTMLDLKKLLKNVFSWLTQACNLKHEQCSNTMLFIFLEIETNDHYSLSLAINRKKVCQFLELLLCLHFNQILHHALMRATHNLGLLKCCLMDLKDTSF